MPAVSTNETRSMSAHNLVNTTNADSIATADLGNKKRFIYVLSRGQESPLDIHENLIFSALARKPSSKYELHIATNLCRKRTIPAAIEKLASLGVVELKG